MNFIDDFCKYCYSYLLKTKDEVYNKFKIFKVEAKNQTKKKINILGFDYEGKYTSNEFAIFYEEHGIIHKVIAPYSSQSNGVAEQKNRTLLDIVNIIVINYGVSKTCGEKHF